MDVFECGFEFRDIERNVLNDKSVLLNKYKEKLSTGHSSNEIVLLSKDFTYQQLLTIVKRIVENSSYLTPREQLQMEKINILKKAIDSNVDIKDLTNFLNNSTLDNYLTESKNEITKDCVDQSVSKTKNFGRRIQQIDPDNLNCIIKVYQDMESLMNEFKNGTFSETGIRSAITSINDDDVCSIYALIFFLLLGLLHVSTIKFFPLQVFF